MELREILKQTMTEYAVEGFNSESYLTENPLQNIYTVVTLAWDKTSRWSFSSLIVHLIGDKIIIDHDANNKPLVDALVQNGIPRQQIILAYAGEAIPENA